MLNKLYWLVACICVIGHLNLIMPSFHEARAMNADTDGETSGLLISRKTAPSLTQSEELFEKEQKISVKIPPFGSF